MVEISRMVKCSNCNKESNLSINTEIGMTELTIHGKCNSCGNSLQVNFSVVDASTSTSTSEQDDGGLSDISLDENLLEPEIGSDAIKDLID